MIRDYNHIQYFIDPSGNLWHGPYMPDSNLHWKLVESDARWQSDLPKHCVEITPLQAAQLLEQWSESAKRVPLAEAKTATVEQIAVRHAINAAFQLPPDSIRETLSGEPSIDLNKIGRAHV